jgi:hypothetical protein
MAGGWKWWRPRSRRLHLSTLTKTLTIAGAAADAEDHPAAVGLDMPKAGNLERHHRPTGLA